MGAQNTILRELREEDPAEFKSWHGGFSADHFDKILDKVKDLIRKEDTLMRQAITPEERLSVTLRFLASGMKTHLDT